MRRRLDWECECGEKILDQLAEDFPALPPTCPRACGGKVEILWTSITNDLLPSELGGEFEWDGGEKSSMRTLADVRKIERITAELAKDGLHRPIVFRQFSQDKSNMSENVFGRPPEESLRKPQTRTRRGVPFVKGGPWRPGDGREER